ncbi:MarP family serine protease [Jatrophihabitans sp.]|uniref:MarP family serine protease n=1 Tax=Jatrophihabitans sp. TaxID=1932789 RepID=UPI0030C6BC24|nr:Colicin production protein [Jatrophihabitans sp.]
MNLVDLFIVIAAAGYGYSGYRSGAVVGALSMTGFFAGAALGAQIAGPIGSHLANGRSQVPVAIVCVLVLAMLGQLLGAWGGGYLRRRFVHERGRTLDAGVGSLLGVISVLLVSWMVAVPLASSPYPTLASAATHSSIVRAVDDVMPNGVRSLYSRLRTFLDQSGFPPVFGDLPNTSITNVAPPDSTLSPAVKAVVSNASKSIFKIYSEAPSCGRGIEGSGFVYAPQHIVTNAHVVAGATQVSVAVSGHKLVTAHVVLYDPQRDVAVLDVPGLKAPVMKFAAGTAKTGESAVVLGYPEDGPFTSRSARVRALRTVSGSNIYGHGNIQREVYSIRAIVRSGNSGGPLIDDAGHVLGIVFATDLRSPQTGYVLSAHEVASDVSAGRTATKQVKTSSCTPD